MQKREVMNYCKKKIKMYLSQNVIDFIKGFFRLRFIFQRNFFVYVKGRFLPVYWEKTHARYNIPEPLSTTSMVCNASFWDSPCFQYWYPYLEENFFDLMQASNQLKKDARKHGIIYHRKLWEFVYILQALYERNMIRPECRGVGFGVGTEALTAIFASRGCSILATDLTAQHAAAAGWAISGQHTLGQLKELNKYGICAENEFERLVTFRDVDMNDIPSDIKEYDFCWSACALEHLGSIAKGIEFIKNSLKTLKSGGIAVHTTEFNLDSDDENYDDPSSAIFSKKDILILKRKLEAEGHYVYPLDFNKGTTFVDGFVDLPPYSKGNMHLRLNIRGFTSTSIGLIIRKR